MKISSGKNLNRPGRPLNLHFSQPDEQVTEAIDDLIKRVGGVRQVEMVRDLILTALKAGRENSHTADLKLMVSTLKEMRYTSKIFDRYKQVRKVSLFGSARVGPDAVTYRMAKELGRKLSQAGYMLITGGGAGIMQAGNEGAGAEHSFGISIRLPFESGPNAVVQGSSRSISYKYFFNRKLAFVKEADAVVLFPGGFGTLDEAMEVLTLVQTGKRYPIPLIMVDAPQGTYWSSWKRYVENEIAQRGYIGQDDLHLFHMVHSVDETIQIIKRFYRRYHSLRFVGNKLVIRMKSAVDPETVKGWRDQFEDILEPHGEFGLSGVLSQEADEPENDHLPKLVMDFNRKDYARLRQLIDLINET